MPIFYEKENKNVVINIGTGKEKSIKEYADFIVKKLNLNVKIKFDRSKPDGVPTKSIRYFISKKIWMET